MATPLVAAVREMVKFSSGSGPSLVSTVTVMKLFLEREERKGWEREGRREM